MNYPKIIKIKDIKTESQNVKTFKFDYPGNVKPGQFFMIWIPGIDEIPMSVSFIENDVKGITFKKVGDATKALFDLKVADKIGVRGPYGNGFKITGKKILFVAGGTGIATITPTVEKATDKKISSHVILGAKNKDEIFFEKRIRKNGAKLYISTDDGSKGYKGFTTDIAAEIIKNEKPDSIITCGPEVMMKKLLDLSYSKSFQASLERYMKCGIGLCGQCCIGKGLRVCEEGPVFDGDTLKKIDDFGRYKKDASGRKIRFGEK